MIIAVFMKKFGGNLRHIAPNKLINESIDNSVDDFFLVLALVYNDLKDVILFQKFLSELYEKPQEGEISVHNGEYGGVTVHIIKLLFGIQFEFLELLNRNVDIINSAQFKAILDKTSARTRLEWKTLVGIALRQDAEGDKLTKLLVKVRSNVAYHYYQPKGLRTAFRNYFFNREKVSQNDVAYYSLGEAFSDDTRFYYADAAVEEYIRSAMEINSDGKPTPINLSGEIRDTMTLMQGALFSLLKVYLKNRPSP